MPLDKQPDSKYIWNVVVTILFLDLNNSSGARVYFSNNFAGANLSSNFSGMTSLMLKDQQALTEKLYNGLSNGIRLLDVFRPGRLSYAQTMHKTLKIPQNKMHLYDPGTSSHYINDLILEIVNFPKGSAILDAGCGFGGTIFRWQEMIDGSYEGITLGSVQLETARKEARRKGLSKSCKFFSRSYDEKLPGRYDIIVAIEALIHSPEIGFTIRNLAGLLKPGGKLIIVDDMGLSDLESGSLKAYQKLKKYWFLKKIPSREEYLLAIQQAKLKIINRRNLTSQVKVLPKIKLKIYTQFVRLVALACPVPSLRTYFKAHLGGFYLQKLYADKKMNYMLYVGQKA